MSEIMTLCKDRLPETDGLYCVWEANYGEKKDADKRMVVAHTCWFGKGRWRDAGRFFEKDFSNIYAWLSLPNPSEYPSNEKGGN